MASKEFSLRFKDRVGLLGKEGILSLAISHPVLKEELPSTKTHDDPRTLKLINSGSTLLPSTRYARISPTPQPISRPHPDYDLPKKNNSVLKNHLPLLPHPKSHFLSRHNISCKDLQRSQKKNRDSSNSRILRINSGLQSFKTVLSKQMLPSIEKKCLFEPKLALNP